MKWKYVHHPHGEIIKEKEEQENLKEKEERISWKNQNLKESDRLKKE